MEDEIINIIEEVSEYKNLRNYKSPVHRAGFLLTY